MLIPLPRQTRDIIGHEAAIHEFMAAWFSGRMHHAWLLTGQRGIGKATLAYMMARWVMADDRPQNSLALPTAHPLHKQVASGSCPTLTVVEPEIDEKSGLPKEINVDTARTITPFLRLTAADNQWRVVIIDGADLLNTESQNAILKILEEPPARCLIILTASSAGRLLPTIRSRCRTLKLSALSEVELKQIATRLQLNLRFEKSWLLTHAAGSIGELIHLTELDAAALHQQVEKLVKGLPQIDWPQVHALAEQVARKENDARFRLLLELLNQALTTRFISSPALGPVWDELQAKIRLAPERHLDRSATLLDVLATAAAGMAAQQHTTRQQAHHQQGHA